jgi:uncharacterized membrane protein
MQWVKDLVVPGVILLGLDAVYLTATKKMYQDQIERVQRGPLTMRMGSAVACYALLIFGLWWFILSSSKPVVDAFLLGIVIYGVYETTTYAVLKQWDLVSVCIDTLWGGVLLALTTFLVYTFFPKSAARAK